MIMMTDLFGKKRWKVNLHTHTSVSDGKLSPTEVLARYREKGYDAVALTDHWEYGCSYTENGITVLSGAEYNKGLDCRTGVFHIVGVGMESSPFKKGDAKKQTPQSIIDAIHAHGGIAILAHPAWSLNTPEQIRALQNIDATEIYNTVSGVHMSRRPDSSLIVDMLAGEGIIYPLIADDDTHYYDGDQCRGWVCVEADAVAELGMVEALRQGRFYATMGPEVHLERISPPSVKLTCSPAVKVAFLSNSVWSSGRMVRGAGITEAVYEFKRHEIYVRAEVTDADGHVGYSNIIPV